MVFSNSMKFAFLLQLLESNTDGFPWTPVANCRPCVPELICGHLSSRCIQRRTLDRAPACLARLICASRLGSSCDTGCTYELPSTRSDLATPDPHLLASVAAMVDDPSRLQRPASSETSARQQGGTSLSPSPVLEKPPPTRRRTPGRCAEDSAAITVTMPRCAGISSMEHQIR